MPDLYAYQDYREYLKQVFEERKARQPFYSYRMWAKQLDIDAAQLYRILGQELQLPVRHLETVIANLKLRKMEAEYFRTLVNLRRAKSEKERNTLVAQLLSYRDVKRKTLTKDQYLLFQQWYHTTVRCLVGTEIFGSDLKKIGQAVIPPLNSEQVQESIELMKRLGLVEKDPQTGHLSLGEAHLSTNEKEVHRAIRDYQAKMHGRAAEALETFDKSERDFSTLTFAVDQEAVEDIKEILVECRRQIQRRIDETLKPDRVMHLSLSLFPTAKVQSPQKRIES